MPKVCFVAPYAYGLYNHSFKGGFGGAEVDVYNIANELARDKNYAVSVIVHADSDGFEQYGKVNVVKVAAGTKISAALKFWKAIKAVDADVYFQEAAGFLTWLVARYCKRYGKRFVYRIAMDRECDGSFEHKNIFGKFWLQALTHASAVIAQTEWQKRTIKQIYGINAVVMPNAYRLSFLKKHSAKYILWIGRCAAVKRPWLFLELAKKMPSEKFFMICPPTRGEERLFSQISKETKKIANLHFIERVPFRRINEYFSQAKVFIMTSEREGTPNALIQAMLAGVPIISTGVDISEAISKHDCGIMVQEGNIAETITALLKNKKRLSALSHNAVVFARRNHDISRCIEAYKKIFESN